MVWNVPKMWEGGECWIIGGGPSVPIEFRIPEEVVQKVYTRQAPISSYSPYMEAIHDRHVIGVNTAFLLGDWINVFTFGDVGFFKENQRQLREFPNLKVSLCVDFESKHSRLVEGDNVKYILHDRRNKFGISKRKGMISWNMNTGMASINLAYHFGVKRIYLLGFDQARTKETNMQHWHSHYRPHTRQLHENKLPFRKHSQGLDQIAEDAKRLGLEIYNISKLSAIKQFPKMKLSEALEYGKKSKKETTTQNA